MPTFTAAFVAGVLGACLALALRMGRRPMKLATHDKLRTQRNVIRLTGFPFQIFLSARSKTTVMSAALAGQPNMELRAESVALKVRNTRDQPQSGKIRIFKKNRP
jgi:hypothetical protein